jgi:nucleoside-diphosphate-sugar epimerase
MDVRDAGAALSALALSSVEGEVNIGTGQAISVADIGTKLGELAGRPDLIELGALPDREGEPPSIIAATGRLINEVAFTPSFSIDQGLQDALGFWVAVAGGDGPRSWHV